MAYPGETSLQMGGKSGIDSSTRTSDRLACATELIIHESLQLVKNALSDGIAVAHLAIQADRAKADAAPCNLVLLKSMQAACRKAVLNEFGNRTWMNDLVRRSESEMVLSNEEYTFLIDVLLYGSPLDTSLYGPAGAIAKAIFEAYRIAIKSAVEHSVTLSTKNFSTMQTDALIKSVLNIAEAAAKEVRIDSRKIICDAADAIVPSATLCNISSSGKGSIREGPQDDDDDGVGQDNATVSPHERHERQVCVARRDHSVAATHKTAVSCTSARKDCRDEPVRLSIEHAISLDDDDDDDRLRASPAPLVTLKRKVDPGEEVISQISDDSLDQLISEEEDSSEDDLQLLRSRTQPGPSRRGGARPGPNRLPVAIDMAHPSMGKPDLKAPKLLTTHDILSRALNVIRRQPDYESCYLAPLMEVWTENEIVKEIRTGLTNEVRKVMKKLANGEAVTFREALDLQRQSEKKKHGLRNVRLHAFQCAAGAFQRDAADAQNVHSVFILNEKMRASARKSYPATVLAKNKQNPISYARLCSSYGYGKKDNKSCVILLYQTPHGTAPSIFTTWDRIDSPYETRAAMEDAFLGLTKCVMICAFWACNRDSHVNTLLRQAFPRAAPLIGLNETLPYRRPYHSTREESASKKRRSCESGQGK